jgi:RNA polymerase sigma-70 factor (ECF subfamily)
MTTTAGAHFATTRWTVVLTAGRDSLTPTQQSALEQLCKTYWYPLYAYLRRKGCRADEAEDQTQAFFAHLLRKPTLANVQREGGRFRSFLLTAMNNFLADEWQKARALKRGSRQVLSLDTLAAQSRYQAAASTQATPEQLYERQWALQVLEGVLRRLQTDYAAEGKAELFEHLRGCLAGDGGNESNAQLAARLNMSEGAVKMAAHRMRQRYRSLLRAEIAQTVASPDDVADELRCLFRALSG